MDQMLSALIACASVLVFSAFHAILSPLLLVVLTTIMVRLVHRLQLRSRQLLLVLLPPQLHLQSLSVPVLLLTALTMASLVSLILSIPKVAVEMQLFFPHCLKFKQKEVLLYIMSPKLPEFCGLRCYIASCLSVVASRPLDLDVWSGLFILPKCILVSPASRIEAVSLEKILTAY